MEDKPMTPREAYERMMRGEEVHTGKRANCAFARHLLRTQAGKLAAESCVKGMEVADDDANPWTVTVTMTDGELSRSAQTLLNAMRSNAHKTELAVKNRMAQIVFFVYCLEED